MFFKRLAAGRRFFALAVGIVMGLVMGLAACGILPGAITSSRADGAFPFDRELLLDARPMPPAKRMPMLTVADDGRATINLWCRSVPARVRVAGSAIMIETAPLPESLPQYMSSGQCNERRIEADHEMLAALAQVTEWRKRGDGVELKSADAAGPKPLRFHLSNH